MSYDISYIYAKQCGLSSTTVKFTTVSSPHKFIGLSPNHIYAFTLIGQYGDSNQFLVTGHSFMTLSSCKTSKSEILL